MLRKMNDHLWLHWTHCNASGDKINLFCNYCKKAKQLKNAIKCEHTIKCSKTQKKYQKIVQIRSDSTPKEINQLRRYW